MKYYKPPAVENIYWDYANHPEKINPQILRVVLRSLGKSYADFERDSLWTARAHLQHGPRSKRSNASYRYETNLTRTYR